MTSGCTSTTPSSYPNPLLFLLSHNSETLELALLRIPALTVHFLAHLPFPFRFSHPINLANFYNPFVRESIHLSYLAG